MLRGAQRLKPASWNMSQRKTKEIEGVEAGSGNVYADLGFPDAGEMLLKARLVSKISEIIRSKRLTRAQTAKILGMTQANASAFLRGRFRKVPVRTLIDYLTSLGRDVEIVVKHTPRPRAGGKVTVVFA